jgi:hypothetical protein
MPGGLHENMKTWEPEEDRLIIEMLGKIGPRWSQIVKAMPGRTVSSIRNRWFRIEKGQRLQEEGYKSNARCKVCGQPRRGHVCFERLREDAEKRAAENDAVLQEVLPDVDLVDLDGLVDGTVAVCGEPAATPSTEPSSSPEPRAHSPSWTVLAAEPPRLELPLLARLKSGERIIGELGFEAAAAVEEYADQDGDDVPVTPDLGILAVGRVDSTRSIASESDLVLPNVGVGCGDKLHPTQLFGHGRPH